MGISITMCNNIKFFISFTYNQTGKTFDLSFFKVDKSFLLEMPFENEFQVLAPTTGITVYIESTVYQKM